MVEKFNSWNSPGVLPKLSWRSSTTTTVEYWLRWLFANVPWKPWCGWKSYFYHDKREEDHHFILPQKLFFWGDLPVECDANLEKNREKNTHVFHHHIDNMLRIYTIFIPDLSISFPSLEGQHHWEKTPNGWSCQDCCWCSDLRVGAASNSGQMKVL